MRSFLVAALLSTSALYALIQLPPVAVATTLSVNTPTLGSTPIDADQSTTVTSSIPGSGGTAPFSWAWYVSYNGGSFNPDSSGSDVCGSGASGSGASAGQTITCTLTPPMLSPYLVTGTYAFELYVSDGSSDSGTSASSASLVVNSPIAFSYTQTTNSASSPYITSSESNIITAVPMGGSAPYGYSWTTSSGLVQTPTCGSSATCSVSASTAGTYSVSFTATDAAGESFPSPSIPVVEPPFSLGPITPGSATIDSGQTVTLTSNPSGGSGSDLYQWFSVTTTVCAEDSPVSGASSPTYAASPTSTTEYYVVVGDAATAVTLCSPAATVTVNPALVAGAPTSSASSGTVILTSHASYGTPVLSYQWYTGTSPTCSSDTLDSGATSATYSTTLVSGYYYCYRVTDQASTPVSVFSATYLAAAVEVPQPLEVTIGSDAASGTVNPGASVTFTASARGGSGGYTYSWFEVADGVTSPLQGTGCASSASSCTIDFQSSGSYVVYVAVTDSKLHTATSGSVPIYVTTPLTVTVTPSQDTPSPVAGKQFTVVVSVSGGTGPYTYTWELGLATGSCSTASCTMTPPATGSFTISVFVSDPQSDSGSATATFATVAPLTATFIASATVTSEGTAKFQVSAKGGVAPYHYAWLITSVGQPYPDASAPLTCSDSPNCSVTWSAPGHVTVEVTVTDQSGQSVTYSANRIVVLSPVLTVSPNPVAAGSQYTVTVSGAQPGQSISIIVLSGGNAPQGGPVCSGTTDSTGSYSCKISAPGTGGTYSLEAKFFDFIATTLLLKSVQVTAPPPPTTVVSILLSPSAPSLPPGGSVTFTATVISTTTTNGVSNTQAVSGSSVSFDVSSGPDQGQTSTTTTDANGIATFTYVNSGGAGTDTVTANVAGASSLASSSVTFVGQYTFALTPSAQGAVATVDVAKLTATLQDPLGNAVSGGSITISVTSGPDSGLSVTATTDSSGHATFALTGLKKGTDSLTATFTPPADSGAAPATATVVVSWSAPVSISSTPTGGAGTSPGNPGGTATLTVVLSSPASALAIPSDLAIGLVSTGQGATGFFALVSAPIDGVAPSPLLGNIQYFVVNVTTATIKSGTMAEVCLSYPPFTGNSRMQYWNGSAWADPISPSATGDTVCGTVAASILDGASFAVATPSPASVSQANLVNNWTLAALLFATFLASALVVALSRRRTR